MSISTPRWRWLNAILLAFMVALVVAACGGGGEDSATSEAPATEEAAATEEAMTEEAAAAAPDKIVIGFLSNCEGPFGPFWETTMAGMNTALVQYAGATPNGEKPSDGVSGAKVPGTEIPIEVNPNYGCSDDTADKALAEAKRLVEQEGVNILLGPLSGDEGIAVANYALEQPDVTFVNGIAGAQDSTLKVQAPNFFRFHTDGAQWTAGLGAYAYNVLGWRNVVTIGDDYSFPYTQVAGFVSEFCSLGGNVSQRVWPALGETDYSSYIADLPTDVDGFFLDVGGTGTVTFVKQYTEVNGNDSISGKMMGGAFLSNPQILDEIGDRVDNMITSGPLPADATDENWTNYVAAIEAAYPAEAANAGGVFLWGYYNGMQGIIRALEATGGVIEPATFHPVLGTTEIETATGPLTLDANRNGVANNYVLRVVTGGIETLATVPEVDQTFGGAFSADTPSPDRDNPECVAGTPPVWAESITPDTVKE